MYTPTHSRTLTYLLRVHHTACVAGGVIGACFGRWRHQQRNVPQEVPPAPPSRLDEMWWRTSWKMNDEIQVVMLCTSINKMDSILMNLKFQNLTVLLSLIYLFFVFILTSITLFLFFSFSLPSSLPLLRLAAARTVFLTETEILESKTFRLKKEASVGTVWSR